MKKSFKIPIPTTGESKNPIEKVLGDMNSSVGSVGSIRSPLSSAGKNSERNKGMRSLLRKPTSSVNLGFMEVHTKRENKH